jgi:hypothetical protein
MPPMFMHDSGVKRPAGSTVGASPAIQRRGFARAIFQPLLSHAWSLGCA